MKLEDSFYNNVLTIAKGAEWGCENPAENIHIIDLNNYLNSQALPYDEEVTFNDGKSIYSLTVDALAD